MLDQKSWLLLLLPLFLSSFLVSARGRSSRSAPSHGNGNGNMASTTGSDEEKQTLNIGIIGMGDMGRLYASKLVAAGWKW